MSYMKDQDGTRLDTINVATVQDVADEATARTDEDTALQDQITAAAASAVATVAGVAPTAGDVPVADLQTALNLSADTEADVAAVEASIATEVSDRIADVDAEAALARDASNLTTGTVPSARLPSLAITDVFVVASQAAMLALAAQRGDVAVRTDNSKTYILSTDSPGTLADWKEITAAGAVTSVNGYTGTVSLAKADVGLGNANDTSDANKPVSTAQATAIASGDSTEATARASADTILQNNITTEATARGNADTTLQANIDAEAAARAAALLAKTLARPNTIALLGDSITWYNGPGGLLDPALTVPFKSSQGYFTWANIALRGRLTLLRQAGTPGDTSAMVLARITDITSLSTLPGYCVVLAGTNDFLNDIASATTIANLTAIHDALIAKGITVVACTMPPVWSASSSKLTEQGEVNTWVRDQAQKPGIIVCDWSAQFANPNGDGTPVTGYTGDGVHPTPVGAAVLGKELADVLRFYVGGNTRGLVATNIDPTTVNANALLTGSAGTLNTGSAGQIATSWIAGRTVSTGTITGAKEVRTDGLPGEWQKLTLSGGTATSAFLMYQDVTIAGIAAGDKYEAEMEFDSLTPTDIRKFTLTIAQLGSGGAGSYALTESPGATVVQPSLIPNGVQRTPVTTMLGTPTGIRISVDFIGSSGSVKVGRIRLRKVT